MRRTSLLLQFAAVLIANLFCARALPQVYQSGRPIELVVHNAPGGGSDVFARAVVEKVER